MEKTLLEKIDIRTLLLNTMEKTLLEKIDSRTSLLKSCIMSNYFELTISDCSVTSILSMLKTIGRQPGGAGGAAVPPH